jgi:hypothetical protein
VNNKAYLKKEVDDLARNIKVLTKLIIEKYDPHRIYDQELVAICSAQCSALQKLRTRIHSDTQRDYQALMDDLLQQTWTAFAAIIGVNSAFVEDLYFGYVNSITVK